MPDHKAIKVALVGNPNTGKTSLFNQLTGLNQKVGNYPGITVDKKVGKAKLSEQIFASIVDLPGTYSINPTTIDENIVLQTLLDKSHDDFPDVIVVVADIENIKRNLLLYSQIKDLKIPTILAINMADQLTKKGIEIDINHWELHLWRIYLKRSMKRILRRSKASFRIYPCIRSGCILPKWIIIMIWIRTRRL